MTTVAWDGTFMAADTLATDHWGLKETVKNKVLVGTDCLVGVAGEHGAIVKWWNSAVKAFHGKMTLENILEYGYPDYVRDTNDPSVLLASSTGAWRHVSGVFIPVNRQYVAIGSGRDYALATMSLGHGARKAVEVASQFDNNTGGEILFWSLPVVEVK